MIFKFHVLPLVSEQGVLPLVSEQGVAVPGTI